MLRRLSNGERRQWARCKRKYVSHFHPQIRRLVKNDIGVRHVAEKDVQQRRHVRFGHDMRVTPAAHVAGAAPKNSSPPDRPFPESKRPPAPAKRTLIDSG